MFDLFEELAAATKRLDPHDIDYALVGGLAYCVWVETRNTEDIDLMIRESDWETARDTLAELGYQSLAPPMDFANIRMRRLTKIQDGDVLALDFLIADESLAEGLSKSQILEYDRESLQSRPARCHY